MGVWVMGFTSRVVGWSRRRIFPSLPVKYIEIIGSDFNGRAKKVAIRVPEPDAPGYFEFEWTQDCGAGTMFCGHVIHSLNFRDAILFGREKVTADGVACQFAYGNLPDRVRRLPETMQELTIDAAREAWKLHPDYNAGVKECERINPWRLGPVVSARAGW
jgi:hypothetical protein